MKCHSILIQKKFIAGIIISGLMQIIIILYTTLGPFIVKKYCIEYRIELPRDLNPENQQGDKEIYLMTFDTIFK